MVASTPSAIGTVLESSFWQLSLYLLKMLYPESIGKCHKKALLHEKQNYDVIDYSCRVIITALQNIEIMN